jgi:hypothetical protein
VRCGERQVGEERPALVALLEVLQQLVAEGVGGIEILGQLVDEGVVLDVQRRRGFQQAGCVVVGRLETVMVGRPGNSEKRSKPRACGASSAVRPVPFAAHQGLVAGLAQQLGQGHHASFK